MPKMTQLFKKTRFAIAYPLAALVFFTASTSDKSLLLGMFVMALGESIRLWANGYVGHKKVNRTRKNEGQAPIGMLITAGPYAFVRHPLYLGTLIICTGLCVAANQPWIGILVIGVLLAVYLKKMSQENELLSEECGKEHAQYVSSVPQLLPYKGRYAHRNGSWSWSGILASKEWKTVLWLGVLLIVLFLRQAWYQERAFFVPGEKLKQALLLVGIMVLIGIDAFNHFKKRQASIA